MKRLLIGALAALMSVAAVATTLSPIQLLNPAGSTSGQTIISSGPSSAPAWANVSAAALTGITPVVNGGTACSAASGTCLDNITGFSSTGFLTRTGAGAYVFQSATNGITLGNLAQSAANTVLANSTGSTANVAAFSMPSCSTSASALDWTSGTGFTCNASINAATLGGATFAAPGAIGGTTAGSGAFTTLSATGLVTPSSTVGIKGTTAADSAQAGSVGEYVTATASGVSLTTSVAANITSVSLTAGDWDISGVVQITAAGSTVVSNAAGGISTTSATLGALGTYWQQGATLPAGANLAYSPPRVRINVSSTTTVFLVALSTFTTSTCSANGVITARRVR